MRSIFSYLLVAILLLNVFGYYGVFMGLQYQNDREISTRLDQENYNPEETITIKVPLAIPYMGETDFERVKGDFEYQGEIYKLVKQRLSHDTLSIICVRNETGKKIKVALADYVKTFTDKGQDAGHHSKVVPNFIKDFLPTEIVVEQSVTGWTKQLEFASFHQEVHTMNIVAISPPPRA